MLAQYHPKEDGETPIFFGKSADFISFGTKFAKETLQLVGGSDVVLRILSRLNHRDVLMKRIHKYITSYNFWLLIGILALALLLHLWGINYRLPYVGGGHSTDEPVYMDQAILLLRGNDTAQGLKTGTLLGYLLAWLGKVVLFSLNTNAQQVPTFGELVEINNVSACCIGIPYSFPQFYWWARVASAICGMLSVLTIYFVGVELKSKTVGLIAALFLALLPLHILHAHFVVRAIPGLLTLLLSFYIILITYKRNCWPCLIIVGGLSIYLAVLTKRNNLILLAPYGLAILFGLIHEFKKRPLRQILVTIGLVLAIILIGVIIGQVTGIFDIVNLGQDLFNRIFADSYLYETYIFGMGKQNGLEWILNYTIDKSYALPVLVLGLAGIVTALRLPNYKGWLLLSIPAPYLILMSFFAVRFHQWLLPPYTFTLILAALFLDAVYNMLKQRISVGAKWLTPAFVLILLFLATPSVQQIIHSNNNLAAPDARDIASEWMTQNIPAGSTVAIDWFGPFLSQEKHVVTYVRAVTGKDIDYYKENNIEYVVGNSQNLAELIDAREDPAAYQEAERQLLRANYFLTQLSPMQQFEGAFDIKVYVYKLP